MGADTRELDKLADDLGTAPARVGVKVEVAVHDATHATAHDARGFAPVFTGQLKAGIRAFVHGKHGEVVSEASYSEYVEDGTSDTAPQPYMGPAHERNVPGLVNDMGRAGADIL